MDRTEAIDRIRDLMPQLKLLGVRSIALFGSVLRNEAKSTSDIDLIAEFEAPHTFRQYADTLLLLEDTLGVRVDLAEPHTLHPKIRQRVINEALRVA